MLANEAIELDTVAFVLVPGSELGGEQLLRGLAFLAARPAAALAGTPRRRRRRSGREQQQNLRLEAHRHRLERAGTGHRHARPGHAFDQDLSAILLELDLEGAG